MLPLASNRTQYFLPDGPTAPNRPFPGPESLSPRLPEPAFSDNSPFLGDSGIVFLGAAAWAIPTEAAAQLSAPACFSFLANKFGQHLGERGDIPKRKETLLKGETTRKRLGIPMFLADVK